MACCTEPIVGVHLDLKYITSGKDYLFRWVRQLPKLGVNTLLIEYEDKFPYRKYPFLRAKDAFGEQQLRDWLGVAREAGLRLVPLVQSCSHLEFALCHEQLAHLREQPHIWTQIDTSNPEAVQFVLDLMDDVLAYHQEDGWFHVGGDEAWHLGWNDRTGAEKEKLGEFGLWAQHEQKIVDHIAQAGKRPIIWDDALWKDPHRVKELKFPKQTIFHSWCYATKYGKDHLRRLGRVDVYKAAGYDSLAAPCLNWGVMTAQHSHCLLNTAAWADAVNAGKHLGIINTAWACFHVLPHAQNLYIAATAEAMKSPARVLDPQWQAAWLGTYFGTSAGEVPAALEALGALWEHGVADKARPITPVIFGYMDMVLWYRDIEHRRAEGAYPLDEGIVDFPALYRQKLDILRKANGDKAITGKLDQIEPAYAKASAVLTRLARTATRNEEEARYLDLTGRMKATHARILRHQVVGGGDAATLRQQWNAFEAELEQVMMPLADEISRQRLRRLWWEPIARSLQG